MSPADTATQVVPATLNRDGPLAAEALTAGAVLDRYGGIGPGFDGLRLFLSLAIVLFHCWEVSYGNTDAMDNVIAYPLSLCILPVFFGLSGFLVTGSAIRTNSIKVFFVFRVLRLIPALVTEVTLAALILGPLLTSLALVSYFSDWHFYDYFGNIIGRIRFVLPGVFEHNPHASIVNINLWTLRPEFFCYLIMLGMLYFELISRRTLIVFTAMLTLTIPFAVSFGWLPPYYGHTLVYSFVVGALAFAYRHQIVLDYRLFATALVLSILNIKYQYAPFLHLSALTLTYCMVYLGMQRFPAPWPLNKGDYSYGIYLYGFPIQQALVQVFPGLRHFWLLFAVATPIIVVFAALSWHLVEKRALGLRKQFLA